MAATHGPLAALSVRPFRWWFIGQVTSASGLMTQGVAMAWVVLQMTNSGLALALVPTAALLPVLLLGLWAGATLDHRDTRTLLIGTQLALATISLLLFALIETGELRYWLIIVISLASGTVAALDGPGRQVYVVELVGRDRLPGAVSLYEIVVNLSRVLGPALGGLLLVISGPAACVLVNAISFLAPLAVLLYFKPREVSVPEAEVDKRPAERPRVADGVRYAWSDPTLRACLVLAAGSTLIFNASVMLPLLAQRVFHMNGSGYGVLLAIFGLGALPGALLAARGREAPTGHRVRVLCTITGVCMVVTALAPDRPVLYVGMAAVGASSIWMIAVANTLVQLRSGAGLRGRVMGAWTVALPGMNPITGPIAGAVADAWGARLAFGASGVLMSMIGVGLWRSFGRD
jgi:MFS family permease